MAVGVRTKSFSRSQLWSSVNNFEEAPRNSEQMTAVMSYQYPLPPAPDVEISPSSLGNNYQLPALGPHSQAFQKSPPVRRGTSGPSKVGKMKRSSSSPNVRGQARGDQADSAFLSLADEKRRNKLGYHRTSVACGHCRRRKIRCIPANGDPQSRCSNCIRLKKECHFHPVDQQTETGPASRRNSQAQGGLGRASSSSSPSNGAGQAGDIQNTLPYPPLSMPPIYDLGGSQIKRSLADNFSTENKVQGGSRGSEYSHTSSSWMPHDSASLAKGSSDLSAPYWRMNSHESPITPAFSAFSPNVQPTPSANWSHPGSESSSRDDISWHMAPRSMSYSHHEGLSHPSAYSAFHQSPADPNNRDDFARPASQQQDVYAPALTPTSVKAETSLPAASVDPTPNSSATSLPPPFSNPQVWQPYPYKGSTGPSNNESFPGWYGQNSPLPPHSQGGEGMPPPTYGHVEPYAAIYYPSGTPGAR